MNIAGKNVNQLIEKEGLKMSYLSQMTETKVQLMSLAVMNMEDPRSWKEFHDVWRKNL